MKQIVKNTEPGVNGTGGFGVDRKKMVLGFCLIGVMAVMWGRLLLQKPAGAQALPIALQSDSSAPSKGMVDVCFVELPKVSGRNDVLTRDLFASNGWDGFAIEGGKSVGGHDVNVSSQDKNAEAARRVASRLKLTAVLLRPYPKAFINEKMLRIGDRFVVNVRERKESCECEVILIEDGRVVLRCGEAEIELKLSQMSAVAD